MAGEDYLVFRILLDSKQYGKAWKLAQEQAKQATRTISQAMRAMEREVERNNAGINAHARAYVRAMGQMERAAARAEQRQAMAERRQSRMVERGALRDMLREADRTGFGFEQAGNFLSSFSSRLDSLGYKLQRFGRNLSFYVTAPLVLAGALSIKRYAEFENRITKAVSFMPGTTKGQRKQMEQQAFFVSSKSNKSPVELAEGYFTLASAGYDAEQVIAALQSVQRFATAGDMEMGKATQILSDTLVALGLRSKDPIKNMEQMVRVSDALTAANMLATGEVQQFGEALTNKTASKLRQLGLSLEEGVAGLIGFAEQGRHGKDAGTLLYIVMRDLERVGIKNARQWKALGLSVYDAGGEFRGAAPIVQDLEKKLAGTSDATKKMVMMQLGFQDKSVAGITALMGYGDAIEEFERKLKQMAGTTKQVSEERMKGFNNQLLRFQNLVDITAIKLGELLAPSLMMINHIIEGALRWWNSLDRTTQQIIVDVAIFAAAMGPVILVVGMVLGGVAALAGAIASLFIPGILEGIAVVALLAAGLMAFAVEMGVVVYAVYRFVESLVGPSGMMKAWEYVKDAAGNFFLSVLGFMYNLEYNMSALTGFIYRNWETVFTDMARIAYFFVKNMISNFITAWPALMETLGLLAGYLGSFLVARFFDTFIPMLGQAANAMLVLLYDVGVDLGTSLYEGMQDALFGRKREGYFFEQLGKHLTAAFKKASSTFRGAASNDILGDISKVWTGGESSPWSRMVSPLEGFTPRTLDKLHLKTDLPFMEGDFVKGVWAEGMKQAVEETNRLDSAVVDLDKSLKLLIKDLDLHYKGIDGVEAGTIEALQMIDNWQRMTGNINFGVADFQGTLAHQVEAKTIGDGFARTDHEKSVESLLTRIAENTDRRKENFVELKPLELRRK